VDSWDEFHFAIAKGWPNYRHIAQPLLRQLENSAEVRKANSEAKLEAKLEAELETKSFESEESKLPEQSIQHITAPNLRPTDSMQRVPMRIPARFLRLCIIYAMLSRI